MHYHLIGIGGIGMAALGSLLLAKGHTVSGSDLKNNELIAQLQKKGALITIGHDASNVKNPTHVIYSSAVRVNNPELIEAESRNIPVLRRAQVLAELVNEQTGITVAGAHGKTTTTSMTASLLTNAGLKPTAAVGGIINATATNANLGGGKYFVVEADESDGTFLYFRPTYSVITNMDFEHVDFYKTWDGIKAAYVKFMQCTVPGGCLITCAEDARLRELPTPSGIRRVQYGFGPSCDVRAQNISSDGFHSKFECHTANGKVGDFELNVPGQHNVLNALACISVGIQLNISPAVMQKTLQEFSGVKRRFQLKGEVDGIMVVDDYGHHPTEIQATLKAARLFPGKRLVTVFQPHRYSRTKYLLDEFVEMLQLTDELLLTEVYAASEKLAAGVSAKTLFDQLQRHMGGRAVFLKKEAIIAHLQAMVRPGDLVLFLGAGDIYHLSDELVRCLQEKKVGV
jgi:UDP-N-acetylmuramate--alanine ligase